MARADAAQLITLADRLSREGPCAQARDIRALERRRTALVNEHRVPPRLAESLSSGVNALVEQMPACVATAPPAVEATAPSTTPVVPETGHGAANHGHDNHGHDKHGHDKHGHGDKGDHGHGDKGGD
jgi:hypothetical protein